MRGQGYADRLPGEELARGATAVGYTKLGSTVRNLDIKVNDALERAKQTEC